MGWSIERYRAATLYEYRLAADGYYRKWEMNTAWLMREICWTIIQWAPFFKGKPDRKDKIIKLSIDNVPVKKEVTKEDVIKEAEAFENKLKNNG